MRVAILSILAVLAVLLLWSMRDGGREGHAVRPAPQRGSEALVGEEGAHPRDRDHDSVGQVVREMTAEVEPPKLPSIDSGELDTLEKDKSASADQAVRITLLEEGTQIPAVGHRFHLVQRFGRRGAQKTYTSDASGVSTFRIASGEYALLCWGAEEGPEARSEVRTNPIDIEIPSLPGRVFEQTVLVRRPEATLRVRVVDEANDPVEDASVYFGFRAHDVIDSSLERTDARGLAFLGVWESREFVDGLLRAWDGEGNVSAYAPVEAPFVEGERVLVLRPAGSVHVSVRQRGADPVPERQVALVSAVPSGATGTLETDDEGRAHFDGVFPGSYLVRVWRNASSFYPDTTVEVQHGETAEVQVTLDEGHAVSGRVVDEEGRGIAGAELVVTPEGRWNIKVKTLSDGSFTCEADPCDELLVRANLSSEGDRFEPASVRVPYGTQDVLFRRVEAARRVSFEVEVVDAETGVEVEHYSATIDRGPETEEWANNYAPRRLFELRVLPETRWRIASKGYLVAVLSLADALERRAEGQRLRVELTRGLDAIVQVFDGDTERPLEGVTLSSPAGERFTTDARGLARVRADQWAVYHASKPEYEEAQWDPEEHVLWNFGPLFLTRSE